MHGVWMKSMGRYFSWALLGAGIGCAAAPGSDSQSEGTQVVELLLTGKGDQLKLDGAPLNHKYQAVYPNPTSVSEMLVRITPKGEVEESCPDAKADDCTDSPFFTRLLQDADGKLQARVFDTYGTPVAEVPVQIENQAADDVDGNRVFSTPQVGGEKTRPQGGGNNTTRSNPNNPLGSILGGGGLGALNSMCPTESMAAAKAKFCEVGNRELAERNIEFRLDCDQFSDNLSSIANVATVTLPKGNTIIQKCREIWKPAENETEATYGSCPLISLNWVSEARKQLIQNGVCKSSPLALDLKGDGLAMSSAEQGVTFNLLGAGEPVKSGWLSGADDALLALDRNGNGEIDGGEELFGDATDGRRFAHGFAALAELDDNKDGRVDGKDATFEHLRLWQDRNHDGKTAAGELITLASADVVAIEVGEVVSSDYMDQFGNEVSYRSTFVRGDGRKGFVGDVLFRFMSTGGSNDRERNLVTDVVGPAMWMF